MSDSAFDVVVIGGGPGGYVAAIRAAQLGFKTACIESRGALGGTCLNVGCIPSKALLQSSELFESVQHDGAVHGLKFSNLQLDLAAMMARKQKIVKGLTSGVEGLLKKNKVTYFKGIGSFVAAKTVQITDAAGQQTQVTSKHIIIATGSEPVNLKRIAPFDGQYVVSSTEALSFETVPEHLVVVGGGIIGLEMGSVWRRLGSKVTVIEAQDRLIPTMDGSLSQAAAKVFKAQGMTLLLSTALESVRIENGKALLTAKSKDQAVQLSADRVLVAVGRRAFTDKLGLEKIGLVTRQDGKIEVDQHFRTKVEGVYAIGDVIDGPMLAHKAEDEGIAVAEIIAGKPGHVNYLTIPGVVYTWPEISSVGYTEEQCKEKGFTYTVGQFPFVANARAKCLGNTDGFVKIIADKKTDQVLGVHMIGPNVSEMIAEAVIAMEFGASAEDIARTCHAHPTLSEAVKEAALAVDGRVIHI